MFFTKIVLQAIAALSIWMSTVLVFIGFAYLHMLSLFTALPILAANAIGNTWVANGLFGTVIQKPADRSANSRK